LKSDFQFTFCLFHFLFQDLERDSLRLGFVGPMRFLVGLGYDTSQQKLTRTLSLIQTANNKYDCQCRR
jgi:hypothetical protein